MQTKSLVRRLKLTSNIRRHGSDKYENRVLGKATWLQPLSG
jgi:hypothetical protein